MKHTLARFSQTITCSVSFCGLFARWFSVGLNPFFVPKYVKVFYDFVLICFSKKSNSPMQFKRKKNTMCRKIIFISQKKYNTKKYEHKNCTLHYKIRYLWKIVWKKRLTAVFRSGSIYLDRSCCRELDHSCWRYLNRSGRGNLDFSSWRDLDRIWWWDQ